MSALQWKDQELTWLKAGKLIQWLKPGLGVDGSVLMAGARPIGKLYFFGDHKGIAEVGAHHWTFHVERIWNHEYVICQTADGACTARFFPHRQWTNGTLALGDGTAFSWNLQSIFRGEYAIADAAGNVILRVILHSEDVESRKFNLTQGSVEIVPDHCLPGTISFLLSIAWYLVLLSQEGTAPDIASTQSAEQPVPLDHPGPQANVA